MPVNKFLEQTLTGFAIDVVNYDNDPNTIAVTLIDQPLIEAYRDLLENPATRAAAIDAINSIEANNSTSWVAA
jgi:hypothetical protein